MQARPYQDRGRSLSAYSGGTAGSGFLHLLLFTLNDIKFVVVLLLLPSIVLAIASNLSAAILAPRVSICTDTAFARSMISDRKHLCKAVINCSSVSFAPSPADTPIPNFCTRCDQ